MSLNSFLCKRVWTVRAPAKPCFKPRDLQHLCKLFVLPGVVLSPSSGCDAPLTPTFQALYLAWVRVVPFFGLRRAIDLYIPSPFSREPASRLQARPRLARVAASVHECRQPKAASVWNKWLTRPEPLKQKARAPRLARVAASVHECRPHLSTNAGRCVLKARKRPPWLTNSGDRVIAACRNRSAGGQICAAIPFAPQPKMQRP